MIDLRNLEIMNHVTSAKTIKSHVKRVCFSSSETCEKYKKTKSHIKTTQFRS